MRFGLYGDTTRLVYSGFCSTLLTSSCTSLNHAWHKSEVQGNLQSKCGSPHVLACPCQPFIRNDPLLSSRNGYWTASVGQDYIGAGSIFLMRPM